MSYHANRVSPNLGAHRATIPAAEFLLPVFLRFPQPRRVSWVAGRRARKSYPFDNLDMPFPTKTPPNHFSKRIYDHS